MMREKVNTAGFPRRSVLCVYFLFGWMGMVLLASSTHAQGTVFSADDGYVEFVSTAPLLEFKGVSNVLAGYIDLEEGVVDFFVDLATLDTGNRRRDRDMRQVYLETETYPFAEFEGRLTTPFNNRVPGEQTARVEGTFTMRDISLPIEVEGTMERVPEGVRVRASWQVRLEDYNIDRPRVVFYELSEVQTVSIDIVLIEQDS